MPGTALPNTPSARPYDDERPSAMTADGQNLSLIQIQPRRGKFRNARPVRGLKLDAKQVCSDQLACGAFVHGEEVSVDPVPGVVVVSVTVVPTSLAPVGAAATVSDVPVSWYITVTCLLSSTGMATVPLPEATRPPVARL